MALTAQRAEEAIQRTRAALAKAPVEVLMPVGNDDADVPVVAVFNEPGMTVRPEPVRLRIVVWHDGNVLWSENEPAGGPPYYEGRIPATTVEALLHSFTVQGVFADPLLNAVDYGPDAGHAVISVSWQGKRVCMSSWWETEISAPRLVAEWNGLHALGPGETREQALARQPASYLAYRRVWSEVVKSLRSLIPRERRDTQWPFHLVRLH